MNTIRRRLSRPVWALLVAGAALGSMSASGAEAADAADARARYENDRAVCISGLSSQDRSTCMREAAAAYEQARRGGLDDGPAPYALNALKRCEPLPVDERRDCVARMQGQGSVSGSVESGGILRELVTVEVGTANDAAR